MLASSDSSRLLIWAASFVGLARQTLSVSTVLRVSAGPDRQRIFFWLSALLVVNALVGNVLRYSTSHGTAQAIMDLFGVSPIIWVAALAALALMTEPLRRGAPARTLDWVVAGVAVLVALVPSGTASAAGLTALSLYMFLTSPTGSVNRRAAAILGSITVSILWGRILLAVFSRPLLRLDSQLVGLFGVESDDNRLFFVGDPGSLGSSFLVAPGCSSLHGISLALVFSTLVHGWFDIAPTRKSIALTAVAIVLVIMINTLRLAAIAFFPQYFEEIHAGWIASAIAWATIGVIVLVIGLGMKREIVRQR